MTQSEIREIIIKLIYPFLLDGDTNYSYNLENLDEFTKIKPHELEYINKVISTIIESNDKIKAIVEKNVEGFELKRIYTVDLCILYLAIYELVINAVLPKAIAIDEAVELSKKYSTKKSPKFINGILAKIVKE